MKDFQATIDKLLSEASECDLVATRATDVQKRELFERLARDYREMAVDIEKIIAVRGTAHLNAIELGQDLEFITERPQIFKTSFCFSDEAASSGETAADGLEVDVVLEQQASDAVKIPMVLAERGVFELHNVDAL